MSKLTHFDDAGNARMVDVTDKDETERTATACAATLAGTPPTAVGGWATATVSTSDRGRGEAVGDDQVVRSEVVDRADADAEHRGVDATPEDVEHVLDAGLAVGREPPQVGTTDEHGAGPERER